MRHLRSWFPNGVAAFVVLLSLRGSTPAQETSDPWSHVRREHLDSFKIEFANTFDGLQLVQTPLLTYSNPVRNSELQGEVYLWTVARRPAFVAAVWTVQLPDGQPGRRLSHEWHSLTNENISVETPLTPRWEAGEPGVTWHDVPEAPAPARAAPLRLVQMRQLAARFTAEIESEGESELRLLPQPIFRYQQDGDHTTDGGLFAFSMGTDPEVLLWIESVSGESGPPRFRCAAVHFARLPVTVRCDNEVIEAFDLAEQRLATGRHHLWFGVEEVAEEPPIRPQVNFLEAGQ